MKSAKHWKIFIPLTVFLSALAFVPAIIPEGATEPSLFGMPRTLWVSMAISLSIYIVLVVAMLVSKEN